MGRLSERGVLDRFIADVRAGEGRALVVRGEPGVGKTVLLDYLAGRASGCRVARAAGVESEMELAFAGLHQLCAPMLDHAGLCCRLRSGRRCGSHSASAPGRRRTGSWSGWRCWACCRRRPRNVRWCAWLMTRSGWTRPRRRRWGSRPGGWRPSRSGWCSRRGVPGEDVAGLPELVVGGLPEDDARELLASALTGPLDERVRDQIIAETRREPAGAAGAAPRADPGAAGGRVRAAAARCR